MVSSRSLTPAALWARRIAFVLAGSALLAASAQIRVPMWPVPITMQTLAIPVLVALLGRGLGTAAVLAYLAEGAAGLPVFQGFTTGVSGPTIGYLIGFPLAAWLTGTLYEAGLARTYGTRFAAVLLGTGIVFVTGPLGLIAVLHLSVAQAIAAGVVPFLLGDVAKCLVAAGVKPR